MGVLQLNGDTTLGGFVVREEIAAKASLSGISRLNWKRNG